MQLPLLLKSKHGTTLAPLHPLRSFHPPFPLSPLTALPPPSFSPLPSHRHPSQHLPQLPGLPDRAPPPPPPHPCNERNLRPHHIVAGLPPLPPRPVHLDVILAFLYAMLGLVGAALVVGLAMVARQAWLWLRRSSTEGPPPPPPNGLKKEDLLALPKLSYEGAVAVDGERLADCAIYLTKFEKGDEIRVLPSCRHSFHVDCIDRWLGPTRPAPPAAGSLSSPPPCPSVATAGRAAPSHMV